MVCEVVKIMDSKENLIKLRDAFKDCANIIDELLLLSDKEDKGKNVKKEVESLLGRFMLKTVEIDSLK